jgi:hypothetical protein
MMKLPKQKVKYLQTVNTETHKPPTQHPLGNGNQPACSTATDHITAIGRQCMTSHSSGKFHTLHLCHERYCGYSSNTYVRSGISGEFWMLRCVWMSYTVYMFIIKTLILIIHASKLHLQSHIS